MLVAIYAIVAYNYFVSKVNGIGARIALSVLSGLSVAELAHEQLDHLAAHAGLHLDAHRATEPAPAQLELDRRQEVVGVLVLERQVGLEVALAQADEHPCAGSHDGNPVRQQPLNPARRRRTIEVKSTSSATNGWNLGYRPMRLDYALLRIDIAAWLSHQARADG